MSKNENADDFEDFYPAPGVSDLLYQLEVLNKLVEDSSKKKKGIVLPKRINMEMENA